MFEISDNETAEITGCKRGRRMSLSMSTNEAAEGGGIGDILRRIPKRERERENDHMSVVSRCATYLLRAHGG